MKFLIFIFLMFVSIAAHATDHFSAAQVASIEKQLNTKLSYTYIPPEASGRLADKQEYINVIYESQADLENAEKLRSEGLYANRCALFSLGRAGELKLISQSAQILNGGDHSKIGCAIKNKFVLISVDGWGVTSGSSSVYKFSKVDDKLELVGLDSYSYQVGSDAEGFTENVSSYNFLTNRGIHSAKNGKNFREYESLDWPAFPVKLIKPYQYKELKFNFKPYRKTLFSDFDFDKLNQHLNSQKNACGNFNEKLKFERCTEVN